MKKIEPKLLEAQYEYGIHDFPYQLVRLGVSFTMDKITPNYRPLTPQRGN